MADPGIEFLVDAAILTAIPEDTNWKQKADERIEKYRKNNINVRVKVPSQTNVHDYQVEIKMTRHAFPFGSKVTEDMILKPEYSHFRELFYYMFNYATMASYFWAWSSGPKESPDYSAANRALDILKQHGIPARGHNIFWNEWVFNPNWTRYMPPTDSNREVEHRIDYIMKYTKGRLTGWDVNNEMLHGHFFENKMNDPYYSHKMYNLVHQADPTPKLFLNDYQIVVNGTSTSAYVDQAREFKAAKIPIYGLGIQSHFTFYKPPDPTIIMKRLDQMAVTGYPLWITELDVTARDENVRKDWYDIVLRMYFSHPSIEGIIFWGFWGPKHWIGEDAALVSGNDYRINAAGQHYIDLLYKEWTTQVSRKISSDNEQFSVRGFHGDYQAVVKYKGSAVHYQTFSLSKKDINLDVVVNDIHAHVSIPTTASPLIYHKPTSTSNNHKVVNYGQYFKSMANSGYSATMHCINQWSQFSQVGDDKFVDAYCPQDYVMSGCSAMTKDLSAGGDGTSIETDHGIACRAWDAGNTGTPVHAIARCCKASGLHCEYRASSKPSAPEYDIVVETTCPNNMYATGCAAHNYLRFMDGLYSTAHSCMARNKGNFGGINSFAICCKAPTLICQVKKSTFVSGHKIGDASVVRCDTGWSMTGCHGISEDGDVAGSFIQDGKCMTFNGSVKSPGQAGVVAYVTCCKI
ncbi:hypothetical protein SNE40_011515 [Patella caerulea]|uniref:GH10 domain-containing protein n=1 Tax=Patella caerulea TaxID=87958 RepID=A0AAN8JPH8_PATCE